jgi:cell wall-associated NlpC family hydrolase
MMQISYKSLAFSTFFSVFCFFSAKSQDIILETVEEELYGVVTVSVADVRMEPDETAEMGTQLLLGMPAQLLENSGGWWKIKTPEAYPAWIPENVMVKMNNETFNQWTGAVKIIFTDDYGFAYETPNEKKQRASDLAFGNLLKWEGESGKFFQVSYPDGRKAYVLKSQSRPFNDWLSSLHLTEKNIIQTALALKGIPYMWGGTSVKGMDCSGFTKTVFLKQGVILRRDASQQAETGIPVDISAGYENLRPGDLMFFGKKAENGEKERIRHVAIYLGDRKFIHAYGYIRINSLDPSHPDYDEHNTSELVRASRIIGAVDTEGIWSILQNPLYRMKN